MSEIDQYKSGEYWEKNPTFHEEDSELKVSNAVNLLERNNIVPKNVLDVGAGSGKNAYLLSKHYEVPAVGIDVSAEAVEHARQNFPEPNLEFEAIDVKEYSHVSHVGFMFDVFEHVEDYLGFLRSASSKAEYWVFNIPLDMNMLSILRNKYMVDRVNVGHLHYFSRISAIATLEDSGYEIVDVEFANVVAHQLRKRVSLGALVLAIPRLALFKINQSFAVNLLGGASLMVLCKPKV
jgi:SAM-dependent methyltransferase